MMKRIFTILLLVASLVVIQPRQAQAGCPIPIPIVSQILGPVCDLIDGGSISKVVSSTIESFWTAFSAQFQMQMALKMNIAADQTDQAMRAQGLMAEHQSDITPSANCAGPQAVSSTNIVAAGGVDSAKARSDPADAIPPVENVGGRPRKLGEPRNLIGQSTGAVVKGYMQAARQVAIAKLTDLSSPSVKTVKDMEFRAQYRNCITEGNIDDNGNPTNNCVFGNWPDADLTPQAIFGQPTYRDAPYEFDIPKKDTKGNITLVPQKKPMDANARLNAAMNYCIMAIMPEGGGDLVVTKQDDVRTLSRRFAERAQNSRLMLAFEVCMERAASRKAAKIKVDEPGYGWLKGTACHLRTKGLIEDVPLLDGEGNQRKDDKDNPLTQCVVNGVLDISDYELFKTITSDLHGNPGSAASMGGANTSELLQILTSMKVVEAQMNQRLYDLQEKAGLLDATMLAVDVERGK